jgi:hypothetical protein
VEFPGFSNNAEDILVVISATGADKKTVRAIDGYLKDN